MGCGSSRSVKVSPAPQAPAAPSEAQSPDRDREEVNNEKNQPRTAKAHHKKGSTTNFITVKEVKESCDTLATESHYGSSESLPKITSNSSVESRNGSAKSNDSGLGPDQHVHNDNSIITENSSPVLKEVANLPENLQEPELNVEGKHMKTPGPIGHRKKSSSRLPPVHPKSIAKLQENEKEKVDLEAILQKRIRFADVLINDLPATSGIVKRPVSRGGVAFDIVDSEDAGSIKKPKCVLKYAQNKRTADVITHKELEEKQMAAKRRKEVS